MEHSPKTLLQRCKVKKWNQMLLLAAAAFMLITSCSTTQPLPTEEERLEARSRVPCIIALPVMTDLRGNKGTDDQGGQQSGDGTMYMDRELKETIKMNDGTGFPVIADQRPDDALTYQTAAELEKGAEYMDMRLKEALQGNYNVRFLSQRQVISLLPEGESAQANLFKKIGSELKCNAVLVTSLSKWVQRVGGEYGVDAPASVTFSMKLFDTSDASVIWSGTFDETQQSWMNNIMSAHKYGFKWLSVEELVTLGIEEKVAQCPYL